MSKEQLEELFLPFVEKLVESSESKYKAGDFKGAVMERREARKIFLENSKSPQPKIAFQSTIKKLEITKSRYNLIEDYKARIDDIKKLKIIEKLENQSVIKYKSGDFRGAIKDLRRAEKYY